MQALSTALGPAYQVSANNDTRGLPVVIGLISILTLLLAIVAGLGVLNTVVLQTRERTRDLGVFKAIGMTPRQVIAMVVCSVAVTGLAAGVIAVPAGVALHQYVLPRMAATADTELPASFLNVYRAPELGHPSPVRSCHRGHRSAAPGGLGRQDEYRVRPPR